MIKNGPKRSEMIKLCENRGFKNWISDTKIDQNHGKLSFSMVSIVLYTALIEMGEIENGYMTLIIRRIPGVKSGRSLYTLDICVKYRG